MFTSRRPIASRRRSSFASSRTFPGQTCSQSVRMAEGEKESLLSDRTISGTSSRLSRSDGTRTVTTLSR